MVSAGASTGGLAGPLRLIPRIIITVRGGMHLRAAAYQFDNRRQYRWLALGAAGLLTDFVLARRLAEGRDPDHLRWAAVDALDTAAWATASRRGHEIQDLVVGNGWTHAAVHAFLSTTGRQARPIPPGATNFPPVSARDACRTVVEWTASGFGPLLGAAVVHRARGLRTEASLAMWPVVGVVSGALFGRVRAGQHRRAGQIWERRSARGRFLTGRSVQFEVATGVEELHDLPRLLAIIGEHHEPCRRASLDARDRPRSLASDPSLGAPLGRVLPYHDVEPVEARMLWLTPDQADQLRKAVEAAEESDRAPVDGEDAPLRLLRNSGTSLRFEYLGREFDLDSIPELKDLMFDPVAAGLVGAAVVKFLSVRLTGMPKAAGVGAALLELLVGITLVRSEITGRRHVTAVVYLSMASCLIWTGAVRFGHPIEVHADGTPLFAASGGMSVLGPIGHYWDEIPVLGPVAAAVALAAWAEAMRSREQRPAPLTAVAELVVVLQYFVATFRLAGSSDGERALLESRLRAAHEAEMVEIERKVRNGELERYRGLLALAREGLAEASRSLSRTDVERLAANLDSIERWMDAEEPPEAVGAVR
ncbi:MAG: hypothetical protein KDB02_01120 [Acidimicrobiales bacterium]|nr:hypothetical protein [Acidimicrobiales bacterium]